MEVDTVELFFGCFSLFEFFKFLSGRKLFYKSETMAFPYIENRFFFQAI